MPPLARAYSPSLGSHCPLFVLSPRLATSVGGERIGSFLLAYRSRLGHSHRAGGWRCRLDSVGGDGLVAWRVCERRRLCSVCGVVVCIYKLGACSCIMIGVERKRMRKDFRR